MLWRARERMLEQEARCAGLIDSVHPVHRGSAANLLHYLALRQQDLRAYHKRLAMLGLSSLGRTEAATLASVDAVIRMLSLAGGGGAPGPVQTPAPRSLDEGHRLLDANTAGALGPRPTGRAVSVMVTMPSEAATDAGLVLSLVRAGMDLMRINCAHDGPEAWLAMIAHLRLAEAATGRRCRVAVDLAGPKIRVRALTRPDGWVLERIRVRRGDQLVLMCGEAPSMVACPLGPVSGAGEKPVKRPARVWCSSPAAFASLSVGHSVWFDDGKIGGVVRSVEGDRVVVSVTHAPPEGARLRADKGVNLPDTRVSVPALSAEDLAHLAVLAGRVDAVGMSFAREPGEVLALQEAIRERTDRRPAVILKVETKAAFERLPEMLFALMRWESCALMIARGDLAVECGWERLAEVQEEVIWLAEACHIPAIWATEVLANLAKEGAPTRAEITDAAMAQRAECVMLNKGPYILEAIGVLDDILRRMASHQRKKTSLLRSLSIASNPARFDPCLIVSAGTGEALAE